MRKKSKYVDNLNDCTLYKFVCPVGKSSKENQNIYSMCVNHIRVLDFADDE